MTQSPTSPPAEPRWRRLEPDERRHQILASAVRHFGERPYADVSVAEVARDAGVARGLVNHYFGNKRDLYLAVVRVMLFVPEGEMEIPGDSRQERIAGAIDWLMTAIEAAGHTWVALSSAGAGGLGADPEVQAILDEADDLATERLLDLVGFTGTPAGRRRAHAAVRAYGGMVKAISREVIDRRSMTSKEARRQLTAALDAVLAEVDLPPS